MPVEEEDKRRRGRGTENEPTRKERNRKTGRKVAENEQDSSGVASARARFMNFTLSLLRDYCKKGCTGESN